MREDKRKSRIEAVGRRLPESGIYQVMFRLEAGVRRRVGALGLVDFKAGYWVYTGRAKRGLGARVARHLSVKKKKRWHIDYILGPGEVVAVRCFAWGEATECGAHGEIAAMGEEGPRGFGSSDCGCATHLAYLGEKVLHIEGFLPILLDGEG